MSRMQISLTVNDDDDFYSLNEWETPYVSPNGVILAKLGNVTVHATAEYWKKIAEYAGRVAKSS